MSDNSSTTEITSVALIKGNSARESVLEGILKLGGISRFIEKGDSVFIKINLRMPNGFPTNSNLNIVLAIISLCKDAGAREIIVGSFPAKHVRAKSFVDVLGLETLFKRYGAKLLLLDNETEYIYKEIKINNKEFEVPSEVLESDKLIYINQVNVDPIFNYTLNLLNSYSIVSNEFQEVNSGIRGKDYLNNDKYKNYLISNILDVFALKKPHLVINDLFYVLEKAGPFIYKDSNLKKTGFIVVGNDSLAVDTITLKLLDIDYDNHPLLIAARDRKIGISNISNIKIIGENLDNSKLKIELCASNLEDVGVLNTDIKKGKFCSGCFNQAYHLLNLMKSNMTKDLKYIINQSFLIGEKPVEPESPKNLLIFGDCAINSTKDRSFRILIIKKRKNIVKKAKSKISKKKEKEDRQNSKMVPNKDILELPGCPPDILKCVHSIIEFYGKDKLPGLNLYYNLIDSYINLKVIEKTEKEESEA
ncbi:MAG: DUF362 domain-containing protein [Candidatus Hermodarchaeota archaeon]